MKRLSTYILVFLVLTSCGLKPGQLIPKTLTNKAPSNPKNLCPVKNTNSITTSTLDEPIRLEGTLTRIISDDPHHIEPSQLSYSFQEESSKEHYQLLLSDEQIKEIPNWNSPHVVLFTQGSEITRTTSDKVQLKPTFIGLKNSPDLRNQKVTAGTRKLLVILVNHTNAATTTNLTDSFVSSQFQKFKTYYESISRGSIKYNLDSDGNGAVDIMKITLQTPVMCDVSNYVSVVYDKLSSSVKSMYTDFAYVTATTADGSSGACGYSQAELPGNHMLINHLNLKKSRRPNTAPDYQYGLAFLTHEAGHTLGLWHSAVGSDDYGDLSCVMGDAYLPMLNAPHVHQLDFFSDQAKGTLSLSQSGTYTLSPLADLQNFQSSKIIKLNYSNTENLFISLRTAQSTTQDKELNYYSTPTNQYTGILFQLQRKNEEENTQLLKMIKNTGEKFSYGTGNSIEVLSLSETSAQIKVQLQGSTAPNCTRNAPSFDLVKSSLLQNDDIELLTTIKSNDSKDCTQQSFHINRLSGETATNLPLSYTLGPTGSINAAITITLKNTSAPSASGTLRVTAASGETADLNYTIPLSTECP